MCCLVAAAAIMVVVAPSAEEVPVCGGLLRHGIARWVILILTAVAFASLHGKPRAHRGAGGPGPGDRGGCEPAG
jgi:hypothetical protein